MCICILYLAKFNYTIANQFVWTWPGDPLREFSQLLDRLSLEPRRLAKEALMVRYFEPVPAHARGFALAALPGVLSSHNAQTGVVKYCIRRTAHTPLVTRRSDVSSISFETTDSP